jgi:hypothetical protein
MSRPFISKNPQEHYGYNDLKSGDDGTVVEPCFLATRDEVAAMGEEIPVEDYPGHGERILVVDVETWKRRIACGFLTKLDYTVKTIECVNENSVP